MFYLQIARSYQLFLSELGKDSDGITIKYFSQNSFFDKFCQCAIWYLDLEIQL